MNSDNPSRYLPQKIRTQIEQNYYARVNFQAELDYVARNEDFLADPLKHVALYSDHGVVHARDVAQNIIDVLEIANGVLIPKRDPHWLEFMKGYGVMLAFNHDIGMMDFSAFGRAMHAEFATQAVFSPVYDEILDIIWTENCGNVAWRLINLVKQNILNQDPKLILRELLSMSVGHSKSKVPIESLNDLKLLRGVMLTSVSTDLRHLYYEQKINKVRNKLAKAQQAGKDPATIQKLAQQLAQAETHQKDFLAQKTNPVNENIYTYYTDFKKQAFSWLLSDHPAVIELINDVTDTVRALRVADALRQRGTTLKTSGGYQIFIDQNTAKALISFQKGSGELLLLETDEPLSIGEANMASSELTPEGDLRVSFHRGAFLSKETIQLAAFSAATVIDDIQRDTIQSFLRSAGTSDGLKTSAEIQILIEETDDNLAFADIILENLKEINPQLGRRSRIVPSLKHISSGERERYLHARKLDWSLEKRKRILARVAQSGHKITEIDPEKAFTDVRLSKLKDGETLIETGAPPGFVYVPMGSGLLSTPLGGYQAQSVTPWIPLGNTRVIRGDVQEATITAENDLDLLMIPKEIYLKFWHDAYQISEFSAALQQLYAEEGTSSFSIALSILEQVAVIDQKLDDAEISFIQRFTEPYGVNYSADEIRAKLLSNNQVDFVTLRQSTVDYIALKPPYLQVARLRDLINLLVKIDEDVSAEESLILSELNSLLDGYLDEDAARSVYKVYIVPQSREQDSGIRALLPDVPKLQNHWGSAYLCGAFQSKDYAEMIRERYRILNFYAVVEQEEG